jgi:hypothetical protein
MYDLVEQHGKDGGYVLAETTYRSTELGPSRYVLDMRNFPGYYHIETRGTSSCANNL